MRTDKNRLLCLLGAVLIGGLFLLLGSPQDLSRKPELPDQQVSEPPLELENNRSGTASIQPPPSQPLSQKGAGPDDYIPTPEEQSALEQLGLKSASIQLLTPVSISGSEGHQRIDLLLDGQSVTMTLQPESIRAPDFRVLLADGNGGYTSSPAPESSTYRGRLLERQHARVSASLDHGLISAMIRMDGTVWNVQPLADADPNLTGLHAVYESADLAELATPATCAVTQLAATEGAASFNGETNPPIALAAADPGTRICELALDADYEMYQSEGSSYAATVLEIESLINDMNLIYETDVDITHQITAIIIQTNVADPYTSFNLGTLLDQFVAEWKNNHDDIPCDIAHLITGRNVTGTTIGYSYQGVVCNSNFKYGWSEVTHSANTQRRVALLAHEIGHNWNANHCSGGSCHIMCASLGGCSGTLTQFSSGSKNSIISHRNSRNCLTQVPDDIVDLSVEIISPSGPLFSGTSFEMNLSVENAGTITATGTRLTLPLPAGFSFLQADPMPPASHFDGTNITFEAGSLAAGAAAILTVSFTADAAGSSIFSLSATADQADNNPFDNQASETLVVLAFAPLPFADNFNAGTLSPNWISGGTASYRTRVTSEDNPAEGSHHVTMDSSTGSSYARNELTLLADLSGQTNMVLTFQGREWNDEFDSPPAGSFSNGADFDGIAISTDGLTWQSLYSFENLTDTYTLYAVDLDAGLATAGMQPSSTTYIRFNQYDNFSITSDGIGIDDVRITGTPILLPDDDEDMDGLPNAWEAVFFANPTNALAGTDSDNDGMSNLQEYIADTNPTNSQSLLTTSLQILSNRLIEISFTSSSNRLYSVLYRTNLLNNTWLTFTNNVSGSTNGTTTLLYPDTPPVSTFSVEARLPPN